MLRRFSATHEPATLRLVVPAPGPHSSSFGPRRAPGPAPLAGSGPRVHLFHGSRMPWNLYDHEYLTGLARKPWFDYTPVVSEDPTYHGAKGLVGTVAAKTGDWSGRTAMVCGSPDMVRYTVQELTVAGVPAGSIRREQFDFQGAASPTEELHDAMETR